MWAVYNTVTECELVKGIIKRLAAEDNADSEGACVPESCLGVGSQRYPFAPKFYAQRQEERGLTSLRAMHPVSICSTSLPTVFCAVW